MNAVAATLDVARSHLAARLAQRTAGRSPQRRGRPPLPEEALLAEIEAVIDDMPSYGYARIWARLVARVVLPVPPFSPPISTIIGSYLSK